MSAPLRAAFSAQSASCAALGSPFMAHLMQLCGTHLRPGSPIADRLLAWQGDVTSNGQSVPLRLAAGLHALVLNGHPLANHYPPHTTPDTALWPTIEQAFATNAAQLTPYLDSPPQTNEVRRSGALILAASLLSKRHGLPIVLSELGASAGLNLNFDRYGLGAFGDPTSPVQLNPDITGTAPAPHPINVQSRAGTDLNPLDPSDRTRLLSYLWPDQPERLALTRAALSLSPDKPDAQDAAPWLTKRLAIRHNNALHLVFHTIAFQYFPPDTQATCRAALAQAGARATPSAPLAHLSLEADTNPNGAALTLTTWPTGKTEHLARADFHGRWLHFDKNTQSVPSAHTAA